MRLYQKKNGTTDWLTVIPVLFWIVCIIISIVKLFQKADNPPLLNDILNSINESTFSTFITMVIMLSYQYFSLDNITKRKKIGLSPEHIALTIIGTIIYGIIAVINVCRYNSVTIVLMFIASIVYVILFFAFMRSKT